MRRRAAVGGRASRLDDGQSQTVHIVFYFNFFLDVVEPGGSTVFVMHEIESGSSFLSLNRFFT